MVRHSVAWGRTLRTDASWKTNPEFDRDEQGKAPRGDTASSYAASLTDSPAIDPVGRFGRTACATSTTRSYALQPRHLETQRDRAICGGYRRDLRERAAN